MEIFDEICVLIQSELTGKKGAVERGEEAVFADFSATNLDQDRKEEYVQVQDLGNISSPRATQKGATTALSPGYRNQIKCLKERKPVELFGLLQPELNGKKGFLVEFDTEEMRWKVKVDGQALLIKPENIKPASFYSRLLMAKEQMASSTEGSGVLSKCLREGKPVELLVQSQPGLKGKKGFLVEFDTEKRKWKVKVNGLSLLIKPEDLKPAYTVPSSTYSCPSPDRERKANPSEEDFGVLSQCLREKKPVELSVLSQPGLKGKKGFLVEFDTETRKWKVKVNGLSLLFKPEDIKPAYTNPCHTRFIVTLADHSLDDF